MLVLASSSPRRRTLLEQLGIEAEVIPAHIDETPLSNESAEDYVRRLAIYKAQTVASQLLEISDFNEQRPVLAGDTAVTYSGNLFGKPKDRADYVRMMKLLSGKQHQVLTAVALVSKGVLYSDLQKTLVTFDVLSDKTIENYWQSGEPVGKAGGYGIQGRAAAFIRRIEGSYTSVMGLPIYEVAKLLQEAVLFDVLTSSSDQ